MILLTRLTQLPGTAPDPGGLVRITSITLCALPDVFDIALGRRWVTPASSRMGSRVPVLLLACYMVTSTVRAVMPAGMTQAARRSRRLHQAGARPGSSAEQQPD